jgi:hypothetical protein
MPSPFGPPAQGCAMWGNARSTASAIEARALRWNVTWSTVSALFQTAHGPSCFSHGIRHSGSLSDQPRVVRPVSLRGPVASAVPSHKSALIRFRILYASASSGIFGGPHYHSHLSEANEDSSNSAGMASVRLSMAS